MNNVDNIKTNIVHSFANINSKKSKAELYMLKSTGMTPSVSFTFPGCDTRKFEKLSS